MNAHNLRGGNPATCMGNAKNRLCKITSQANLAERPARRFSRPRIWAFRHVNEIHIGVCRNAFCTRAVLISTYEKGLQWIKAVKN